jgi:ABC-type transport system substrate-binding protein
VGHIGSSSNIEEITFAPGRALTKILAVRQALSWSLDRQSMINQLFGAVTFSPSVALSAIFSQGQTAYPGTSGSGPTGQATTTTTLATPNSTPGLADCLTCAIESLTKAGYKQGASGLRGPTGAIMTLKVAVGPSALDVASAALVIQQWRSLGIRVTQVNALSDTDAAADAASNIVDAAIFSRSTQTTPSFAARSWAGPAYADSYPSGFRSSAVTSLYNTAITNFNPVAANTTWLALDQLIMTNYWVRPLFTSPSLVEWSTNLANVVGSLSTTGFLDEVTTWTISPPAAKG